MSEYGKIFPSLYIGSESAGLDRELLRYDLDVSHLVIIERPGRPSSLPRSYSSDFTILRMEDVHDDSLPAHEAIERFDKVGKFVEEGRTDGTGVFVFG